MSTLVQKKIQSWNRTKASPHNLRTPELLQINAQTNRFWHKRLKAENFRPDATIDLHGLTCQQAEMTLRTAIAESLCHGHRYLLAVTGKGQGALSQALPQWLNCASLKDVILGLRPVRTSNGALVSYQIVLRSTPKAPTKRRG